MIITDSFVFIHMHKTGGQTINRVIETCIPNHEIIGYHYPRAMVPIACSTLPVVAMVRNPWDWYVSWYFFNLRPGIKNPLFSVVSHGGTADFFTTVRNLINLGADTAAARGHRADLVELLPDTLDNNRGVGLIKDDLRHFLSDTKSYYSWLFERMVGTDLAQVTHIGRFEMLQCEFLAIMEKLQVSELATIRTGFNEQERKNTSRHSHYSHYYDESLRELVASKDADLIERFHYEFAPVGPVTQPTVRAEKREGIKAEHFQKLLGRADNYLRLHDGMDVSALVTKLAGISEAKWQESGRERRFDVHKDTQALMLVHFEDHRYLKPEYRETYSAFVAELKPFIQHIASFYQDNGFVVRLIFARLLAGGKIPEHTDTGYSLLNCHRVHVPIITNDNAVFIVGGEQKLMRVGEFWEINNGKKHAVTNAGKEDRTHLIIDWIPNPAGKSHEEVLRQDLEHGPAANQSHSDSLNLMVAEAFHTHRAGNARRAKSLYKQVLDIDPEHIEANNLLGLLSLQSGNPQDAIRYIETAIAIKPDDAQAQANLGLARKDVGQFDQAAAQFQKALKLQPKNPKTHNNLGNALLQLGRLDDAIACYRNALILLPSFAAAHRNLGNALMRVNQFAEAAQHLQQALTINPDLQQAHLELQLALDAIDPSGDN